MSPPKQGQRGYTLVALLFVVFAAVATFLVYQGRAAIEAGGKRVMRTQDMLAGIQKSLVQFSALNGRLPCPANPALATTNSGAGFPNQNSNLATAVTTCTYPAGVVPWKALGLRAEDVMDEWGRMISYRVFDGSIGLTQAGGASRVNCDTTNGSRPETYPTNGLCSANTNTLDASYVSHKSFPTTSKTKGLVVSDFGTAAGSVAFALISHGPSGLGAYLPSGTRMDLPAASASDYANTQAPTYYPSQSPAAFISMATSTAEVTPGTSGHYDDVVSYLRLNDFAKLTRLTARDWPEAPLPTFSPSSAPVPGAAPTTDPLNPRWTTTGTTSANAFTAATVSGQTVISGPTAALSQSSCLWWPNLLTLNSVSSKYRQSLAVYVEFAATDNTSDPFPGLTMGFLSGLETQPGILTCGTTGLDAAATGTSGAFTLTLGNTAGVHERTTATGSSGSNVITVGDPTGIVAGMNVTGTGIGSGATVASIAASVVTLSVNNASAVSGTLTFTNILDGMNVSGTGVGTSGTGAFATVSSISGNTVTLNRANTAAISGTVNFANSRLIRRNLGWAGGTLASYTNRFAVEFDANIDTGTAGPPVIASASDPSLPHLAADYAGVTHGADAEACSTTAFENPCDMPPATFSATTVAIGSVARVSGSSNVTVSTTTGIAVGKLATGTGIGAGATVTAISGTTVTLSVPSTSTGSNTVTFAITASLVSGSADIVVSTASGIANGMSVTGTGIGSGATVASISGTTVTLSVASTSTRTSTLAFASLSTSNFMQNGLTVFHSMRADVTPFACLSKAATTGTSGAFTITVPNKTALAVGMGVSGANIATGATIRSISPTTNVLTLTLANTAAVNTTVDFSLVPDATKTATGTSGASTVTVSNTRWLGIGMSVTGAGIGASAMVTDISGTTVTLSVANAGTVSGTLAFTAPDPAKSATGTSGQNTVVVSDTTGIAIGMRALGDGIADGTTVTGISGTTLTLSANNTDAIAGTVTLRPAQTQFKAWTLTNAGCAADSIACNALKNTSVTFSQDMSSNDQALGILVCLDTPSPSTAFDDVYFGFTTSNRTTTTAGSGSNISLRALSVENPAQP